MITREQVESFLGEDKKPFKTKGVDYDVIAISLLRERIPYDVERKIIQAAEHDIIYLCGVESALSYLSESDLEILADCNIFLEEDNDCFALFT